MNDIITAATSGLFVEVGKVIEHMKAQQERIADLERQLAEASAPAVEQDKVICANLGELLLTPAQRKATDTDKVRELAKALEELADVAQQCDSWQSFPEHALEKAQAAIAKATANMAAQAPVREVPGWIACDDRLPDMDSLVWLFDKDIGAFIGERNDTGEGWLWGRAETYYQDKHGDWQSRDCEQDDFNITHWQPLPALPAAPVQQEGASNG